MLNRIKNHNLIAMVLVTVIPFLSWYIIGEEPTSISDLYYTNAVGLFVAMLVFAGSIFIQDAEILRKRRYNLLFGISLIIVALTPYLHKYLSYVHIAFAGIFYVGHAILMIANKEYLLASFVVLPFVLFGFGFMSLFWAENIANTSISYHYYFELKKTA